MITVFDHLNHFSTINFFIYSWFSTILAFKQLHFLRFLAIGRTCPVKQCDVHCMSRQAARRTGGEILLRASFLAFDAMTPKNTHTLSF